MLKERGAMNRYRLLILVSFVIIVISGCASPEKVIKNLEAAVEEEDETKLYKLVEIDEGLHWTEKEAGDVINYFRENTFAFEEQLGYLNEQKEMLKEKQDLVNEKGFFYFNNKGKLFVRAFEVALDKESFVDFNELIVSIDDEEKTRVDNDSSDDVNVGLFGPGKYDIEAMAHYGYVDLKDRVTFELFNLEEFQQKILMDLKGNEISIITTEPGTYVYIDDYKINEELKVKKDTIIQPIVEGMKLQAKREFSWGELVSETLPYKGELIFGLDVTPHIFANESEREEIIDVITDFNEKLLKGLSENKPSYLDDVRATKEAVAGYDETFKTLDLVKKGELKESDYPYGIGVFVVGQYKGGLLESLIDFHHANSEHDKESAEDVLLLNVNLYTDFKYIPESKKSGFNQHEKSYYEPIIQLVKQDNKWLIKEQIIELVAGKEDTELVGEGVVRTKIK